MKRRTHRLRVKVRTFGRGPHYLFMRAHHRDMESAMFFGAPLRYSKSFFVGRSYRGLMNMMTEARISIDKTTGAEAERQIGMSKTHKALYGRPTLVMFDDVIDDVSGERHEPR